MSLDDGVFRCHFVRYDHTSEDLLKQDDFIIFTFHHGSFDGTAIDLFLNELTLAYSGNNDLQKPLLQYIDYAAYERSNTEMSAAKNYWYEILRSYPWDRKLDLPYDFGLSMNGRRSGRCWFVITPLSSEITEVITSNAKQLNVTLFQLMLTCFYIFLAQLSPYNQDACVTIPIKNRYRPELENIIGLFVNMLPCRMTFDTSSTSTLTFIDLLHKVQNNLTNMMKYGNMSYSEILELHRVPTHDLQAPFIHTYFDLRELSEDGYFDKAQLHFIGSSSDEDSCTLSSYYQVNDTGDEEFFAYPNMFDMDITIFMDKKDLVVDWSYSMDLFSYSTIDMLSKQFLHLLSDLFLETPLQQLKTTPLVKLVSMAKEPINSSITNHHRDTFQEEVDSTAKPLTSLEEHIQAVFRHVLNIEHIDVNKSFFEQGGTSMKALQAIYLLQDSPMTSMIDTNLFFCNLSVTKLSQAIEAIH